MIKITEDKSKYYDMFLRFKYFNNFLKYVIKDMDPIIFVDNDKRPKCVVLYSPPAYFISGNPKELNLVDVFSIIGDNSWIIPDSLEWKSYFENYYEDNVKIHQRVLFDSSLLTLEKTREYKTNLPEELKIVKIEKEHVASGLIFQDVTSRFFTVSDFMKHGFGFALVDKNNICQGFALTNYPVIGKEVELYFRIGYEDYPKYRQKGLGTLLCSYFIEYCLLNGYTPVWDAANDISSHIAHKFGYIPEEKWYMYHVIKKVSKTKE